MSLQFFSRLGRVAQEGRLPCRAYVELHEPRQRSLQALVENMHELSSGLSAKLEEQKQRRGDLKVGRKMRWGSQLDWTRIVGVFLFLFLFISCSLPPLCIPPDVQTEPRGWTISGRSCSVICSCWSSWWRSGASRRWPEAAGS